MMKIDPLIFDVSFNARPWREVRRDASAAAASGSGPEAPVSPAAAAEGHAIAEERNGRWRGLDPAGLPPQWQGTVRQLWVDMTRQGRQASTPSRQIRGAAQDNGNRAEPASQPSDPAGDARFAPAGPSGGLACEPPSLPNLSDETINQIARLLPDADIGHLSLVNRRLRDTLAEQRKVRGLVRQALQVSELPEDLRWDALCRILDATDALSAQCRSGPLTAAADVIHSLPQPKHQWLMLNRVHAALAALDQRRRVAPLAAIAEQLCAERTELTDARRRSMFERILTDTGGLTEQQLRVAPLEALARLIPQISASYRRIAFKGVLAAVAGIEVQHRSIALTTLLHNIHTLPSAGRRGVFDAILAAVAELAASDRSTLLARLPLEIDHLPPSVRSHAFDAVLSAIARLAAPERAALLMCAARHLSSLSEPDRPDAFERIYGEVANLAEDERRPLLRLLQATYMAPDVRQHYADPIWADWLAIVPDPEGTPVVLERAMLDGTMESRHYWTGSVQFGEAGNRNVLLEPVDTNGARRWYLAGRNGERLSQYLERRYSGTLTSDSVAPAPLGGLRQQRALRPQL